MTKSSQDQIEKSVADQLRCVKAHIEKARTEAPKSLNAATELIAVSKTHAEAKIREAIDAGQRHFGENRVQEALDKWPQLKREYPDVVLHMIGGIQSNKVRQVINLFDVIHTIDRPKLVRVFARVMKEEKRSPKLFVQVNTGNEKQKNGVAPTDLPALLHTADEEGVSISGLMCIPPVEDEPAIHFAFLRALAKRHGLKTLSMGMSADYELASQMGANFVRVGTAIFGSRH